MVDSLAMFFGAKKRRSPKRSRKSPKRSRKSPKRSVKKSYGVVVVKGRERKLYKGVNGGLYYKTKSGKTYVNAKFVRKHSPKRMRKVRKSPKRRVVRKSPKRKVRKSPKRRTVRRSRYGYGLGQPSLLNMMGPAGLTNNGIVIPTHYIHPVPHPSPLGPGGEPPKMM